MLKVLIALQVFLVAFLLLHDWIPLGRLNDTAAVRTVNPGSKLLLATVISTSPYVVGLVATIDYVRTGHPHWVALYLWISYAVLFFGELSAWWIPYFFGTTPQRIARYKSMFGNTHAFLQERNGTAPNTLHVALHVLTLATLITLGFVRW